VPLSDTQTRSVEFGVKVVLKRDRAVMNPYTHHIYIRNEEKKRVWWRLCVSESEKEPRIDERRNSQILNAKDRKRARCV